jgi:hypothetical protein
VSDEPVLDTVLVGPRATGLRAAAGAVAFYAAHPEARPRPGPLDRGLFGLGTTLHAARLVAGDRALLRAAFVPTALTFGSCAVLALLATLGAEPEARHAGATFQAFLVSFVALASMPPTILQRLWIRVAREARRALGLSPGEDPFPNESFVRMTLREGWKAVRQAVVVSFALVPLLALVQVLPLGRLDAALLAGAWAFYWVVVDAFELPLEVLPGPRRGAGDPWFARLFVRLGTPSRWLRPARWFGRFLGRLTRPWHEEVELGERHAWETAGFGLAVGALLAVPVVGLFFRAVAITAATALVGRLDAPGSTPRGGPATASSSAPSSAGAPSGAPAGS